jgi:hypothetical protein
VFGGASDDAALAAFGGEPAVHLLLRLNTADPAVGVTIPGVQWLPRLGAIRYGACDLGYRVTSDRQVKLLHQAETRPWDGFPHDGYPERLPISPRALEEGVYDPSDPKNALFYAAVFGYDALRPVQFAALARHVEKDGLRDIFDYQPGEDYLRQGNCLPFSQGPRSKVARTRGVPTTAGCRRCGRSRSSTRVVPRRATFGARIAAASRSLTRSAPLARPSEQPTNPTEDIPPTWAATRQPRGIQRPSSGGAPCRRRRWRPGSTACPTRAPCL